MAKVIKKSEMACNSPKKTPGHATKSHVVKACAGGKEKIIRFGQQGVSGAGSSPSTPSEKARQKSFKARHAKNIAKGNMSAAYWADKVKW
jgi:hypothetical protein